MSGGDGGLIICIGLCGILFPRLGFVLVILLGILTIVSAPVPVR